MKAFCYLTSTFVLILISTITAPTTGRSAINDRPIIGIVAQEVNSTFALNATSYIMASYVKLIEAGGARVVPIMIYKPVEYYRDLLSKINGVLFPGGSYLIRSKGYGRAGKIIFGIAKQMNEKGDYFPLWGTCLGFELLNFLAAKRNWMITCAAKDLASNLKFVEGSESSKIFSNLDKDLKDSMLNQNITFNNHRWCLTPSNYSISHLDEFFKVVATDEDSNGLTYVSVIEAYKYPFYGVAFHPEKALFEWVLSKTHQNIPHSAEAVEVSQYFSRFFVNEARKSTHHFPTKEEENALLIYNYNPIFTGKRKNYAAQQVYFFN